MESRPEPREDEEPDLLITPEDAVKEARREHEREPRDESTTEVDKVRESGFGV